MRNGSRRSGDPTTSPRSASLNDTYLSSPMKRGLGKTHSRMAVRFSVSGSRKGLRKRGSDSYQVSLLNTALHLRSISRHPCKVSFTGEQIYSTMKDNKLARKAVRKTQKRSTT